MSQTLLVESQPGRFGLARRLVPFPLRLLAGRRAELSSLAAGTDLDIEQRLAHARHVSTPAMTCTPF